MHVYACIYMYVYIHTCICLCVCIYIYIYTYTYMSNCISNSKCSSVGYMLKLTNVCVCAMHTYICNVQKHWRSVNHEKYFIELSLDIVRGIFNHWFSNVCEYDSESFQNINCIHVSDEGAFYGVCNNIFLSHVFENHVFAHMYWSFLGDKIQ
jgi:hypothetical protein